MDLKVSTQQSYSFFNSAAISPASRLYEASFKSTFASVMMYFPYLASAILCNPPSWLNTNTLVFPPVPAHSPFEHVCVHFITDEKIGFWEAFDHGVIEAGHVLCSGQFFFGSDKIVLGEIE